SVHVVRPHGFLGRRGIVLSGFTAWSITGACVVGCWCRWAAGYGRRTRTSAHTGSVGSARGVVWPAVAKVQRRSHLLDAGSVEGGEVGEGPRDAERAFGAAA